MKYLLYIVLVIGCLVPATGRAESMSYNEDGLARFRTSSLLRQIVYRVESSIQTFFMAHKDMIIASQCRLPAGKYLLRKHLDDASFIRVRVQVIGFEEGTLVISLISSIKDGEEGAFIDSEYQMFLDGLDESASSLNSIEGARISDGVRLHLFTELKAHLEGTMPFVDPKGGFPGSAINTYDTCQQGIARRLAKVLPE